MRPSRTHRPSRTILAGSLIVVLALFASVVSAESSAASGVDDAREGERVRTLPSAHDFDETRSRLESAIEEAGLTIVTTIDHASNAASAGLKLPPTTLLVFGNPEAGTPLMRASLTMALDLPQKMLVWEDESGGVHVSFRDPVALAADHGLAADEGALPNIAELLPSLARTATGSD